MADRETAAQIETIATDWAVLVDDRPLTVDEQSSLDAWLAGDVRRLGAFARARAAFTHVARAKALGSNFDPGEYHRRYGGDVRPAPSEPDVAAPLSRPASRRGMLLGVAGLTTVGAAAALGFSWQAAAQTVSTRRGEVRLVPLRNGSTMTLNTDTTVRLLPEGGCDIELLRGEAMFDIADKGRPFVVRAGSADVRIVVGTIALANLANEPVQLIVEQGAAELRSDVPGSGRCRVSANRRAIVSRGQPVSVTQLPPNAVLRSLAWRDGKLAFEDTPLRAAAAEFARYSDTRIVFADPAIGSATVTGLFSANNPVGFAESVATSLELATREADGSVELRERDKNI